MDQRQEIRRRIEVPVAIDPDINGRTKNISSAGVLCEVDKKLPVLYDINIVLQIQGEKVELKGTTLRCTPVADNTFDLALFFNADNLDETTRIKIAEAIAGDLRQDGPPKGSRPDSD